MMEQARDRSAAAHEILETGFQRCLKLTADLQPLLKKKVGRNPGLRAFSDTEVSSYLGEFSERLYTQMARTLFDLLLALQPQDCSKGPVNFYFWPGYHSYLIKKRVFIRDGKWNFGVGIFNSAKPDLYRDCSQARWYQYLIGPRNKSAVVPIDIHRQLLRQSATQDSERLSKSFIVTTASLCGAGGKQEILELPPAAAGTQSWGQLLVEMLESQSAGQKSEEEEDPFIKSAKATLQSIWLHTAFCEKEPPWLRPFIEELGNRTDTEAAGRSLRKALEDETAMDWGDRKTNRPIFRSWVNLSLRAWLNPLGVSPDADQAWKEEPDRLAEKTVGSAALLCSVPIRPQFLDFARAWISEVYNTVRNAEMAVFFHNQQLAVQEALMAGPHFAHEIQLIIDQSLTTAQKDFADNRPETVETRRFVLYSIRTLCNLAYSFTNAILSENKNALEENKREFIDPLRTLRGEGKLLVTINCIAREIYKSVKRKNSATVIFPATEEMKTPPEPDQHGVCFLLTAEMLRNYCQPQNRDKRFEAQFRSFLDDDTLIVEMIGSTGANRTPASMTLARIDRFLRILGVGDVHTTWDQQAGEFTFRVTVDLESPHPTPASDFSN